MRQLKIQKTITNRDSGIDKFLFEISHIPMLSIEEEIELAAEIRKGGRKAEKARNRLVCANLRFVVSVAKQYQHQGLSLTDLIDEGNFGLIKAAELFDETRGFKFISYAVWWIRQSIMQAIAEQSRIVRLPLNQVGSLNKISKAKAKFEQEHMREPSIEELSALTGQDERTIAKALNADQHHVSFDKPFQDGEDNTLLDVMPSGQADRADRIVDQQSLEHDISSVLDRVLSERESFIIRKAFGLGEQPMGLEYIGEELGLTRERVRQICDKGIRKLQESGCSQILQKYL